MNYNTLITELGLSDDDHDRLHYGWLGEAGRAVQARWAYDIVKALLDDTKPDDTSRVKRVSQHL